MEGRDRDQRGGDIRHDSRRLLRDRHGLGEDPRVRRVPRSERLARGLGLAGPLPAPFSERELWTRPAQPAMSRFFHK